MSEPHDGTSTPEAETAPASRVTVPLWQWTVELDASLVDESLTELRRQVREYAAAERRSFDLTVETPDDFTGAVMDAMQTIPRGETRTYGELAAALDTAAVAVGRACGRNPLPVVVPCHRVVAADGLGGYSGDGGVPLKKQLLELESE